MKTRAVHVTHIGRAPHSTMRFDRGTQVSLVDGRQLGAMIDAHVNIIKVGSAPGPYHLHRRMENFYLVLKGILTLRVNDETLELAEGSCVLLPPGVPHAASNLGDEPVELLELYVPASELPDFEMLEER